MRFKRKAPEFRYSSEEGIKGKMAFPYTSGWLSGVSPLSTKGGQALIGIVINLIPYHNIRNVSFGLTLGSVF